uniref:Uncharacterized protein n=1 Tax=Globisporangium ultimum (strain ATCC 200006 / CBS 805.95 / DAOM BR144) TaxID=431595 RepID=K3XCB2_GLOUD
MRSKVTLKQGFWVGLQCLLFVNSQSVGKNHLNHVVQEFIHGRTVRWNNPCSYSRRERSLTKSAHRPDIQLRRERVRHRPSSYESSHPGDTTNATGESFALALIVTLTDSPRRPKLIQLTTRAHSRSPSPASAAEDAVDTRPASIRPKSRASIPRIPTLANQNAAANATPIRLESPPWSGQQLRYDPRVSKEVHKEHYAFWMLYRQVI